jgi:hypothetical protein
MIKRLPPKQVEATEPEVPQPEPGQEVPEPVSEPAVEEVKPELPTSPELPLKPKPLTMVNLKAEIDELHQAVQTLITQVADVQALLALKRKPTDNSKVQIKDKLTGKTYKSKNNAYQSLLKSGELKDLVDKGVFGNIPEKNNFGWFALQRSFPDRFEEVQPNGNENGGEDN